MLTLYNDSIPTRNIFVSIFFFLLSFFLPLIFPFFSQYRPQAYLLQDADMIVLPVSIKKKKTKTQKTNSQQQLWSNFLQDDAGLDFLQTPDFQMTKCRHSLAT